MGFLQRCYILVLLMVLILSISVSGTYYKVGISDGGDSWSVSRRSINASFDLTGSSMGEGNYYRYTEIDVNDVRMSERITATDGSLDTDESVRLRAVDVDPIIVTLVKHPGGQNYLLTINETWPVSLSATRSTDYLGARISDRETFGNNLDYVGTSHLYATDFRKDRACGLDLKNACYQVDLINGSLKAESPHEEDVNITNLTFASLEARFMPAKYINYSLNSYSDGLATLRYKQTAEDYSTAIEGLECYAGTFRISRRISMASTGRNATDVEADWLDCCLTGQNNLIDYPKKGCIFEEPR